MAPCNGNVKYAFNLCSCCPDSLREITSRNNAASGFTTIPYWSSNGQSSYHALQATVERRLSHGLTYSANYAWSHGLDDAPDFALNGSSGFGDVPSQIRTLDYGNSDLDLRHRFVTTGNYQLPFGQGIHGYKGTLIKGWQGNVILVWGTGHPFTVLNATNSQWYPPRRVRF